MNVQIRITRADPEHVRASGHVQPRGKDEVVCQDVTARLGFGEAVALQPGKYTYVFGVDRKGTFTVEASNADNGTRIGQVVPYGVGLLTAELRYHFEVPE